MIILTIRTDNPQAEIGLYEGDRQLAYQVWTAHRQLGNTIHEQVAALLKPVDKEWDDIQGIVAFQGPGSFTGLRIGLTVANTLAYSQHCPIVGSTGEQWIDNGVTQLLDGQNQHTVMPEYGAEVHITQQKK